MKKFLLYSVMSNKVEFVGPTESDSKILVPMDKKLWLDLDRPSSINFEYDS